MGFYKTLLRKFSKGFIVTTLLSLVTFSVFYYTSVGAKLVVALASYVYSPLKIEKVSGAIAETLTFDKVVIDEVGFRVSIDKLQLSLEPRCFLIMELCVNNLALNQSTIHLNTAGEAEATENTHQTQTASPITSPFPVTIKQLKLQQSSLYLDGNKLLTVDKLQLTAAFSDQLNIADTHIRGVKLYLAEPENTQDIAIAVKLRDLHKTSIVPIDLPQINIPLNLQVSNLNLHSMQFLQENQEPVIIPQAAADISLNQKQLKLSLKRLDYADFSVKGEISSDYDYRYDMDFELRGSDIAGQLRSSGSPHNIAASGWLRGKYAGFTIDSDFSVATATTENQLPLNLEVQLKQLEMPDGISLVDTDFLLSGNLGQFALKGKSQITTPWWADTELDIEASGNLQQLQLEKLKLDSDSGSVRFEGILSNHTVPTIELNSSAKEVSIARYVPEIHERINLDSQIQLVLKEQWQLHARQLVVSMPWKKQQAQMRADALYNQSGALALNDLQLQIGDNQIHAQLNKNDEDYLKISADIQLPKIQQLLAEASGNFSGELRIQGPMQRPEIQLQGQGAEVHYEQYSVQQFDTDIALAWSPESPFRVNFKSQRLRLTDDFVIDLSLDSIGEAANHDIDFHLLSDGLQMTSKIQGSLSEQDWQATLMESQIAVNAIEFSLTDPLKAKVDLQHYGLQVADGCWLDSTQAKICIDELLVQQQRQVVKLNGSAIPAVQWLQGHHPKLSKLHSDSLMDFDLAIALKEQQLSEFNLNSAFKPGNWQLFDEEQQFFIDVLSLKAELSNDILEAQSNLAGESLGEFRLDMKYPVPPKFAQPDLEKLQLAGQIQHFSLAPWSYLIPQIERLQGEINGELNASFDESLTVNGQVQLSNGALTSQELGLDIKALQQQFSFEQHKVKTQGTFNLGQGEATLSGEASWLHGGSATFKLQGEALSYDDNLMVQVSVSPDLDLILADQVMRVSGSIEVPKAKIKIKSIPESALKPSADIRLPDHKEDATGKDLALDLDVALLLDPKKQKSVTLEAFGLVTALTGDLQVQGKDSFIANGEVSLLDGTYKAYGQNLIIRQGDLLFNGPVEFPTLQIEAIRDPVVTSDNVVAGLRVSGPARQPTVTVFSNPEMSQAQALSYLLSGKALGAKNNDSQETILANALLSYGLNQSENVVSRLGKSFGVKDLSVAMEGQGDSSRVAVSGTIAPNVKLTYGVGVFDAVSEVALRYQLLPQLYLEAVSGLANALDLFYEFTYEPEKPQEKAN